MTGVSEFDILLADLDLMYAALLPSMGWLRRVCFWLTNSEFHCVACYRFGRATLKLQRAHPWLAVTPVLLYRLWNRWATHLHHTDLSRRAEIGPGFLLMHRHGVIIGPAVIGSRCVVHQNVTIGQRIAGGDRRLPRIGDDVWIGPGAVVVGGITVGDGVTVSAGTILSRDVPPGCLVGGNPGRVIAKDYDRELGIQVSKPPGVERTAPRPGPPQSGLNETSTR